ncbi:hypothetical protein LX15_002498 [Streptoalloteichus tenebrarius]|uniref:Uncharacterized protein n=1 Tax=Streptoalloteichus tenebrarius (strain ATCC 17920 / DSM 40477 / JCM 4838 / CBS 697.72 / NBRC 16177 / NCIMB 11028 / NRRL B-12390 / A12253. 1 / ISP 5477) TaxID=1933 RepID=A0ABT1HTR5_STRSD|nr:hypothetical protein [Streptoalloteichus tenebrarius]BFE99521.1 hypothetical protein GCM10020241_11970 [Streptoalloteichus tenebrarius]
MITLAPNSSSSSRIRACAADSPTSTPPPGVVQYGACPGFVRSTSTSQPSSSTNNARAERRTTGHATLDVTELNDHAFEDARDLNHLVVERIRDPHGDLVSPRQFAAAILQIPGTGRVTLAYVTADDIRELTAVGAKRPLQDDHSETDQRRGRVRGGRTGRGSHPGPRHPHQPR